jgi:hypothetical protein
MVKRWGSYHLKVFGSRGGSRVGAHSERAPPKIGKNVIFWRKIVIFHTKYLKNCRASLRSAQFFLSAPSNLKSWIRPWISCALRVFQLLSPITLHAHMDSPSVFFVGLLLLIFLVFYMVFEFCFISIALLVVFVLYH